MTEFSLESARALIARVATLTRAATDAEIPPAVDADAPLALDIAAVRTVISRARALLEQEARNNHAPLPVPSTATTQSTSTPSVTRAHAVNLMANATAIFRARAPAVIQTAVDTVAVLDGLPVSINPFEILGASRLERSFQTCLRWLLDQHGNHGLGDRFLRRFLAHAGLTLGGRIFDYSRTLDAVVLEEFEWTVPAQQPLFRERGERALSLRCDLLVLCPPHVVPVELKVFSPESIYRDADERWWAQAALYTRHFAHSRRALRTNAPANAIRLAETLDRAARRLDRYDAPVSAMLRQCSRARGVLLHLGPTCCLTAGEGADGPPSPTTLAGLRRQYEHSADVRHVDWRDVAAMCADFVAQRGVRSEVSALVMGLAQSVYENVPAGDGTLLSAVEEARLRCAEPRIVQRFPMRALAEAEALINQLNARPPCCWRAG